MSAAPGTPGQGQGRAVPDAGGRDRHGQRDRLAIAGGYALPFNESLGFVATAPRVEADGIAYVPMRMI